MFCKIQNCFFWFFLFCFYSCTITIVKNNVTVEDRLASFGSRLPEDGFVGKLMVLGEPGSSTEGHADGCHPIKLHLLNEFFESENWIALISRGNCSFIEKVRNMQRSGFAAVIVGNNDHSGLVTMFSDGDTSDVIIPSVFITQKEYIMLRKINAEDPSILVRLTPNDFLQPFLDVVIVTILSPTIMLFFVYVLWRIRQRQLRRAQLASPAVVENLPTRIFYLAKRKGNEPEECAICLEDYVDKDNLRILPCKHEFHITCIDPWLTTRKKFCPICKQDICPYNERTPLLGASVHDSRSSR